MKSQEKSTRRTEAAETSKPDFLARRKQHVVHLLLERARIRSTAR